MVMSMNPTEQREVKFPRQLNHRQANRIVDKNQFRNLVARIRTTLMQSISGDCELILTIWLMMILPDVGLVSWINIRNVVVFPAPFAPWRIESLSEMNSRQFIYLIDQSTLVVWHENWDDRQRNKFPSDSSSIFLSWRFSRDLEREWPMLILLLHSLVRSIVVLVEHLHLNAKWKPGTSNQTIHHKSYGIIPLFGRYGLALITITCTPSSNA